MNAEDNSNSKPLASANQNPLPKGTGEHSAMIGSERQIVDRPPYSGIHKIFLGPNGLRAGWRLFLFYAMLFVPLLMLHWLTAGRHQVTPENFKAGVIMLSEFVSAALALGAAVILGRIERRTLGDYGLPLRRTFIGNFLEGLAWGFLAECGIMAILYATGNFSISGVAQHGAPALKFALLWGLAFLGTGIFEEFSFRGYPQFTLTLSMGFWPAAFLLSGIFWLAHMGNPGETWIGGLATALVALAFCVALYRTGNLWFPIGMHAAWDWTETYFFGVPDSGMQAHGYLLNSSLHGSKWLTGGTVGPEGSVVTLLIVLLVIALLFRRFPTVKYPISKSRQVAAGPEPVTASTSFID